MSLNIKNTPFSRLIVKDKELAETRKRYASLPKEERRCAADYQYHSSIANEMFDAFMGTENSEEDLFWGEIVALAIDPTFAPALLSVGSLEYQYGRVNEGMKYFLELTDLPAETENISEIIDKAGTFLTDKKDYKNALNLYSTAANKHLDILLYHEGMYYCYGKMGQHKKAVEKARYVVSLDPDNYVYLSDLGGSLLEAEEYDEAQSVLERAVLLAPPDYKLAQGNLNELRKRKQKKGQS